MKKELTKEQRIRILKAYLGRFYGPVEPKLKETLEKSIKSPEIISLYIEGDRKTLRQVGAWALLHWGEMNYVAESTYDIVNRFLGICSDEADVKKPFYNTDIPLLIVYHLETTLPNKYTADCLVNVWDARRWLRKPTIILSCCTSQSLQKFFRTQGVPVLQLSTGLKVMKVEVGSVEKERKEDKVAKKEWYVNTVAQALNSKQANKKAKAVKQAAVAQAMSGNISGRQTEFEPVKNILIADL